MNILIIGLGSIAKKHIEALEALKVDTKIYALRSSKNASYEKGVINIYDIEATDRVFDFAIISNPTHLHFQFIEKLAKKGIPLFIEKPAIHSLDNAEKLVAIVEDEKIVTYVACNLRFHPCLIFLKNKIDNESLRINEVNVYCGSYLPDWRPGKDFREIYSANANMGGGVHLDLFHELDYTTWLFGLPNKSNSLIRSKSSLAIDAIDYANYTFEYDDFTANIVLNYYRRKPKREIEIVLEEDTWLADLIKNEIKNDAGKYLFKAVDFNPRDTYKFQLDYFISCLKNKHLPMNSLKESIGILEICLNNES
jgi:predicted dehydrogenase